MELVTQDRWCSEELKQTQELALFGASSVDDDELASTRLGGNDAATQETPTSQCENSGGGDEGWSGCCGVAEHDPSGVSFG